MASFPDKDLVFTVPLAPFPALVSPHPFQNRNTYFFDSKGEGVKKGAKSFG